MINIFGIFMFLTSLSLTVSIDTVYLTTSCNGASSTVTTGISLQSSTSLQYSNSMNCYYIVNVPTGYMVLAVFRRYEIEDQLGGTCVDYVNFYDGASTASPLLNSNKYCGTTVPSNITSTSNSLTVEFVTDTSGTRRGFDLLFTAFSAVPCSSSQYTCSNDRCIAKELECDSYNQCEDNSDESHCTEEDLVGTETSDNAALIAGLAIGLGTLVCLAVLIGIYMYRQYRWKQFLKDPLPVIQQWDTQNNYPLTRKYYKTFNDGYKTVNNDITAQRNGNDTQDERPSTPNSGNSSKGILKVPQSGSSVA